MLTRIVLAAALLIGAAPAVEDAVAAPAPVTAGVHTRAPLYRCNRCRRPIGDGDRALGHTLCLPCRSRPAAIWRWPTPPEA